MKTVRRKSVIPVYLCALTWLIFGLSAPIYQWRYIFLAAGVSAVVFFIASALFPGEKIEIPVPKDTGDRALNRQIAEGRAMLESLRESNDAIPAEAPSREIERMETAGRAIFDALEKNPAKREQVRRFTGYYLPTADKLLKRYRDLLASGGAGANVTETLHAVESSLAMIADAFEKQLDGLYKDEALDIQTDIDVLETKIASEGLASAPAPKL